MYVQTDDIRENSEHYRPLQWVDRMINDLNKLNINFRCLEESGWNLPQALSNFETARKEEKIPIEAFEKF